MSAQAPSADPQLEGAAPCTPRRERSMADQVIKLVIAGVLLLHGVAHVGPLATYIWIRARPADNTGGWVAARSWLLPTLPATTATAIASAFWLLSLVGFLGASLSVFGLP